MIRFTTFIRESIDSEYPRRPSATCDMVVAHEGWMDPGDLRDPVTVNLSDSDRSLTARRPYAPSLVREVRDRFGMEPRRIYCSSEQARRFREEIRSFNLAAPSKLKIRVELVETMSPTRLATILSA